MNKPRVVLTGADGQLGLTVRELWSTCSLQADYELSCYDVDNMDITQADQVTAKLDGSNTRALINGAAYTAVDRAEVEAPQAIAVNATGATNLAQWCSRHRVQMIQLSTDFVFDGRKASPYLPDDETKPRSVYGHSKREGEKAVLSTLPETGMILRTAWLYSPFQSNFVKTMLGLMADRDTLAVVDDQLGSPTSTRSLASCLIRILERGGGKGIYHWTDAGQASWYEFARAIQEQGVAAGLIDRKTRISAVASSDYPTAAERPRYSVLDSSKTQDDFQCEPHPWREELSWVIERLANNTN